MFQLFKTGTRKVLQCLEDGRKPFQTRDFLILYSSLPIINDQSLNHIGLLRGSWWTWGVYEWVLGTEGFVVVESVVDRGADKICGPVVGPALSADTY